LKSVCEERRRRLRQTCLLKKKHGVVHNARSE
jgi:hypothetical protein